jgi:hypothetical protein
MRLGALDHWVCPITGSPLSVEAFETKQFPPSGRHSSCLAEYLFGAYPGTPLEDPGHPLARCRSTLTMALAQSLASERP